MAAEDLPEVWTTTLFAFMVPPPVVIRPPEQSPFVTMVESAMLTTLSSP